MDETLATTSKEATVEVTQNIKSPDEQAPSLVKSEPLNDVDAIPQWQNLTHAENTAESNELGDVHESEATSELVTRKKNHEIMSAATEASNQENVADSSNGNTKNTEKSPATEIAASEELKSSEVENTTSGEKSLSVKRESQDEAELPDNFFDELLECAEAIQAAVMSPGASTAEKGASETDTPSTPLVRVKSEKPDKPEDPPPSNETEDAIPEHFFDDLLVDRVAERLEDALNEDIETKYSERLKELRELEELERTKGRNKSHKKHKKSKKKSRKRSRSRNRSDEDRGRTRSRSRSNERSRKRARRSRSSSLVIITESPVRVKQEVATSKYDNLPRLGNLLPSGPNSENQNCRQTNEPKIDALSSSVVINDNTKGLKVKSEFCSRSPSRYDDGFDCLSAQHRSNSTNGNIVETTPLLGFKRIKLEKPVTQAVPPSTDIEEVVTPKMKRERAVKIATATIKKFRQDSHKADAPLTEFLYTTTVRKLPANSFYVSQQFYENRSPLHTVNNVSYKFNSHATSFNFQEWGLEVLPPVAARVARLVGCDANTMFNKLQTIKIPPKMQKLQKEKCDHGEEVEEVRSSFFTNAMTQTDDVRIISGRRRNGHDIGVQAVPHNSSIGAQTTDAFPDVSSRNSSNDDLPLMKQLKTLNENQLLALSDFAELIQEPASDAMDMYRLRQRMLDIYKCSQLPSALAKSPTQIGPTDPPPPPIITNVRSVSNEIWRSADPRRPLDPRQRTGAVYNPNLSPHLSHSESKPKFYGRGGLRR